MSSMHQLQKSQTLENQVLLIILLYNYVQYLLNQPTFQNNERDIFVLAEEVEWTHCSAYVFLLVSRCKDFADDLCEQILVYELLGILLFGDS